MLIKGGAAALLVAIALVTALAVMPMPAQAHAVLVRSVPLGQSGVRAAPAAIDLWFSEPLEPKFSRFELFAGDGSEIPLVGMRVDPADDTHLSAFPESLVPGVYTVVYRTLSTRDGHEWTGSFAFTVMNADGSVPSGTAFSPDLGGLNSPTEIVSRWFTFFALSIVVGGAVVVFMASRVARDEEDALPLSRAVRTLYLRLSLAVIPLLVAGTTLLLISQHEALGGSIVALVNDSRFGTYWLWRALALAALSAAVLLALFARSRGKKEQESTATAALPLIASGALLTVTMLSHAAAAPGRGWAISSDFLHVELAAAWAGGVAFLAALFLHQRRRLSDDADLLIILVGRFSIFAAVALFALAMTGIVRSAGELPRLESLYDTGYGRWLLVKLALLLPVLAVALANRAQLARWSRGDVSDSQVADRLRRLLPLEAALAALVLFSVAIFGQVPTARGAVEPPQGPVIPYNRVLQVDDLSMHLQVTPARMGMNELVVHLYHADGSDPGDFEQVRLTLGAAFSGGGGDQLDAEPIGNDLFTVDATFASFSRTWAVTVDARRTGLDDARGDFRIPMESGGALAGAESPFGSPAPQLDMNLLWAMLLLPFGLVLVISQRTTRGSRGSTGRVAGVAAIFVAAALAISADQHRHGLTTLQSPNPGDPTSIAQGAEVFATNCASCHGETGKGDGPAAAGLSPPPADLKQHIPLHSEGQTFLFVSDGLPGSAMPAWSDQLTEEQMWDVVNYLRAEFLETSPLLIP